MSPDADASDVQVSGERRRDYRPTGTSQGTSLFATLKRTATEFSEDNLSDWAAALTYYGLLAGLVSGPDRARGTARPGRGSALDDQDDHSADESFRDVPIAGDEPSDLTSGGSEDRRNRSGPA
jgi:hypothetical protein